jgi:hypothetical protein
MNAMTCAQMQEQLDLLAADACDPPTRAALESHLAGCPACAARFAESQRLIGLLDLKWNEQAIKRLERRIEQQSRPPRRIVFLFVRRAAAVAALVLIAIGLILWLPSWTGDPKPHELAFALLVQTRRGPPAPGSDKIPDQLKGDKLEALTVKALAARGGKETREDLIKAQRDGKLPLPQAIALDLALVNTGDRAAEVRLGDATPTLELDLPGDSVVRLAAPGAEDPEYLRPQTFQLAPGKSHVLHINRLIAGSPGKLEYIYVTERGDYTLTARVRLTVEGKVIPVPGPAVRIRVGD